MRNPIDLLTGKVSVTVQLEKSIYNLLTDATALNGQTPSEFIANITRSEIKGLIENLPVEWFDRTAITKKYGLEEAKQPKA
jgi:uncharacterized protein (DUF1778 family)